MLLGIGVALSTLVLDAWILFQTYSSSRKPGQYTGKRMSDLPSSQKMKAAAPAGRGRGRADGVPATSAAATPKPPANRFSVLADETDETTPMTPNSSLSSSSEFASRSSSARSRRARRRRGAASGGRNADSTDATPTKAAAMSAMQTGRNVAVGRDASLESAIAEDAGDAEWVLVDRRKNPRRRRPAGEDGQ